MKLILLACAALLTLPRLSVAGNFVLRVLYRANPESLVRVSADGQSRTVIATVAGGGAVSRRINKAIMLSPP